MGDLVEAKLGRCQEAFGVLDPGTLEILQQGLTDCLLEASLKCSTRYIQAGRQPCQVWRMPQTFKEVGLGLEDQVIAMLNLRGKIRVG